MFGSYHAASGLQSRRIFSITNHHPLHIFFNEWDPDYEDKWIKFLGVNTDADRTDIPVVQDEMDHQFRYPRSLTHSSLPPYARYNQLWYFTHCRMERVTDITCCVSKTVRDWPIIGILLGYDNGRRRCLGQYRLDWALAPLRKDTTRPLNIGLGRSVKGFPYVAKVCVEDSPPDSLRWLKIPAHGCLEWWLSPRQCKLRHFE